MAAPQVPEVLRVVHELYHNPDPQVVRQAEKWLSDFQQGSNSWPVIINVLQDGSCPLEAKHLCALALRNKCMQDLEELPKESIAGLRETIVLLLLDGNGLSAPIRTQICLAFSGLAAHIPGVEWDGIGVIAWIEQRLAPEPKVSKFVEEEERWKKKLLFERLPLIITDEHHEMLQPLSVNCLVEVLCILAEECGSYKPAVHPSRRRAYTKELEASCGKAFHVLTHVASNELFMREPHSLRNVLQALASWLNLGGPSRLKESCANTDLHQHPLVQLALKCLGSTEIDIFDNAIETVCVLVHGTLSNGGQILPEASALVNVIITGALSLRPQIVKYVADSKTGSESIDMEDMVKAISRLVVESSEAFIYYIASAQAESLALLEAMLDVTSHPDSDVSSMTFGFWYRLSKILSIGMDPDSERVVFPSVSRQHTELFAPVFSRLICCVQEHLMYGKDVEKWTRSDHHDFKKVRYAISDALMDANQVLGAARALQLIMEPLQKHHAECNAGTKQFDWRVVEATCYAVQSIARSVPLNSAVACQLLGALPSFPKHPQLVCTCCQTVGAYADWIAGAMNQGCIPDKTLLSSLLSMLSSALYDETAATAAAVAFRRVCYACCTHLVEFSKDLYSLFNASLAVSSPQSEPALKLKAEDVLEMIEGMVFVVLAMPVDERNASMQLLLEPILVPLQASLADPARLEEGRVLELLEQITTVFKNLRDKQFATQLLDSTSWILDRTLELLGSSVECAEKVCKALKYGLKASGNCTPPSLLENLFTNIPVRFATYSHPCLLYLSSELVKIFGKQAEARGWLQSLVCGLVNESQAKLREANQFDERPDLVDDLFLLSGRMLSYAPEIVFSDTGLQILQQLFNCGLRGMFIQHREACISILSFFYRLLDQKTHSAHPYYARAIEVVVVPEGLAFTKRLLAGATGMLPKAYLDDVGECLQKLLRVCGQHAMTWVFQSLSAIPDFVLSDQEKQSFMVESERAAGTANTRAFSRVVDDLSETCRRNARTRQACTILVS